MKHVSPYNESDMLRSFSLVFSRSVFKEILEYQDFSRLDSLIEQYNIHLETSITYGDIIRRIYRIIRKSYCCEYVYKNEFLTRMLIRHYGTSNTIAFNEFKIPPSIVDIALFNGESKAFEIKTEYDTPKRLDSQLDNYCKFFDKCYLIIPEDLLSKYLPIVADHIGILLMSHSKLSVNLFQYRDALNNEVLSPELVMRVLRTQEFKNIISHYYGALPNVSCFEMFDYCSNLIKHIPTEKLRLYVLNEIKSRRNSTPYIKQLPSELRQIALSLNLKSEEIVLLKETLNKPILKPVI